LHISTHRELLIDTRDSAFYKFDGEVHCNDFRGMKRVYFVHLVLPGCRGAWPKLSRVIYRR
jgi:hypothetical protein